MDSVFRKMPPRIENIARFMQYVSNRIIRDFQEIKYVQKKDQFFSRTISFLNRQCEDSEIELELDGGSNFVKNISLWCLVFSSKEIGNNSLVILEPMVPRFFWGQSSFFLDDKLISDSESYQNEVRILPQHITQVDFIYLSLLLMNQFDLFYPLKERSFNFETIKQEDNCVFSDRIQEKVTEDRF